MHSTAPRRSARLRISRSADLRFPRAFIRALGLIKSAAARVNGRLGQLPPELAASIEKAADAVAAGDHDAQFVVDIFQTGSGTSTNMNANEVIAHLAGAHPNDHVNRGQSSNDVIPSAIHVSAAMTGDARSCCRPWRNWLEAAALESRRVPGHRQDRPHSFAGRRADDAWPGVQRLRRAGGALLRAHRRRRSKAFTNCRWAEPRSAPD